MNILDPATSFAVMVAVATAGAAAVVVGAFIAYRKMRESHRETQELRRALYDVEARFRFAHETGRDPIEIDRACNRLIDEEVEKAFPPRDAA